MLAKAKYVKITLDIILPILAIIVIGFVAWGVLFSPLLAIRGIECLADYKPCQNENVVVELSKSKGENLLRFDEGPVINRLKSGDFMLQTVTIKRVLPGKLIVETFSVNPETAVQLSQEPNTWVVCDKDARVIKVTGDNPNVPTVTVEQLGVVRIGAKLQDPGLPEALALATKLRDHNLVAKRLFLVDQTTVAASLELTTVLFTTTRDAGQQVQALQAILADSTIKEEKYKTIDLRFAQPILRQN